MTAVVEIQRLMKNLRVKLPGSMDAAIQLELFNTMDAFFQRTNIWQEDISFTTVVNDTSYDVYPAASTSVINRLMWVKDSDGIVIDATMATPGAPGTIDLRYAPSNARTLTATVALTTTDPVDGDGNPVFPIWVLNKYNDVIEAGVLGRMYAQPAKPWSNLQLASFYQRKFDGGASEARVEVRRKNTYATGAWRFPQSFATRRRG